MRHSFHCVSTRLKSVLFECCSSYIKVKRSYTFAIRVAAARRLKARLPTNNRHYYKSKLIR